MSPHSDTLSLFRAIQSLVFLLNGSCLAEKQATHTNFIVFGLTQAALEPTVYRTRGEHANHYTTDAVKRNTEKLKQNWIKDFKYLQTF